MAILEDPNRQLIVSEFLRLETIPHPSYHKQKREVGFMESVFAKAEEQLKVTSEVVEQTFLLAQQYDLDAVDSLHVGSALLAKVDEFITLEKPSKPMFRVKELQIVNLYGQG